MPVLPLIAAIAVIAAVVLILFVMVVKNEPNLVERMFEKSREPARPLLDQEDYDLMLQTGAFWDESKKK